MDNVPIFGKQPVQAPKKIGCTQGLIIMPEGMRAALHARKVLIRSVVEDWIRRDPRHARNMARYLNEITKVEHSGGKWRTGRGEVKVRFPQDLWGTMRIAFRQAMPDEPAFGEDDIDIQYVYEEFPKLLPNPNRSRRIQTGVIIGR